MPWSPHALEGHALLARLRFVEATGNGCRRRTLASMGTHDLDNVSFPVTYEAHEPEQIQF